MTDTTIEVKNIGKCYKLGQFGAGSLREEINRFKNRLIGKQTKVSEKDFWALKNVSFDVQRGEVVGLIGKNGAGKSTMLKVLSRITEPTEGDIYVRGRVASLLEVGTGFHPELSGRDNIFLNGTIMGMKRAEIKKRFDEIVSFAGIEKHIDTPVKRYSSGMFVRLGFAIAAHMEPEILIVDEVLAVGDAEFQQKCIGKMKDVSQSGRTVIFVSHNMGVVRSLCSRCVWLDKGQVRMEGTSDEVVRAYSGRKANELSICWKEQEAHQGPYFSEIRVSQPQHNNSTILKTSEDIVVDFQLGNLEANTGVISIEVRDKDGSLVVHAGESYMNPDGSKDTHRQAIINRGALAEGTYSLDCYFYSHNGSVWHRVEGLLNFSVHLDDCVVDHELWRGSSAPGIVTWKSN